MPRYKFYLDNTLLQDEPYGSETAEIVIERDKDLRGLFYNFMTGLEFWGDGYDIINNKLTAGGVCETVTFLMQEQCADYGPYEDLYTGIIFMDTCDFDLTRCTVKCEIEDANFSALLQKHKETDITINKIVDGFGVTMNGSQQPDIAVTCKFHGTDTGTYDYTNRTAYPVKDALEYITRYITDNGLTVNSTFLTAGNYQPYIVEVFLQNGIATGTDTIEFEFINSYGQTIVLGPFLHTGVDDSTVVYRALRIDNSGFVTGQAYMDTNFIFGSQSDCSGNPSTDRFVLHGWSKDVQLIRVTVTGTTPTYNATITECQPFAYTGAYPFVLSSMNKILVDNTRPVITNFKSLLQTLTACFGVAYRFTNNGSGPVMQVEQINTFFDDSEAVKLTNVNNVIKSLSDDFICNSCKVGEDNSTEELMFRPETWSNPFCLGDELDAIRTFKATGRWDTDPNQDKNLIVHVEPDGGNWQSVIHTERILDVPALTFRDRFWYNAPLVNINCLFKNEFLFSGDLRKDGYTYLKTGDNPNLVFKYEFEHPLTATQINALINNPINFVAFDGVAGWINEISIPVASKVGKFVLLSAV